MSAAMIAISGCRSLLQSFEDTFLELVTVENPNITVGILTLSIAVPEIQYFLFGRPYYYFRFSVPDAITRGTFFELAIVENSRIVFGILSLSIVVPDIKVFPVWATILLFPVVGRCCKTVNIGSIGFLAMENPCCVKSERWRLQCQLQWLALQSLL